MTITINDEPQSYSQEAVILNGSTVVPLRALFEQLGASVYWLGETETIIALKDFKKITLTLNDDTAYIDTTPTKLDQPATTMNGNTMVPLRFIGEALGAEVGWTDDTRTAAVYTKPPVSSENYVLERARPFRKEHRFDSEEGRIQIKPPAAQPIPSDAAPAIPFPFDRKWKTFATPHLNIFYFENEAYVFALSPYLEEIYAGLSGKLGHSLTANPSVYLLSVPEYDAFSKKLYNIGWSAGKWDSALNSIFLRVDANRLGAGLLITFRHEMTHALTLNAPDSKPDGIPLWFREGAAAYREVDAPFFDYSRERDLREMLKTGAFLNFRDIPARSTDWLPARVPPIYAQSQSMYGYLVRTYGEEPVTRIFYLSGSFEERLKAVTGRTLEELQISWLTELRASYSREERAFRRTYDTQNDQYEGELNHGERDGTGLLYFGTGSRPGLYFGAFRQNRFNGRGISYNKTDDMEEDEVYEGEFREGQRDGDGKLYRNGKLTLEGEFRRNRQNSGWEFYRGRQYLPNGVVEQVDREEQTEA